MNARTQAPSVDSIIRYESGEMDDEEIVAFFQDLVDSGMAWQLQGHYGRTAQALIQAGVVVTPAERDRQERRAAGSLPVEYGPA